MSSTIIADNIEFCNSFLKYLRINILTEKSCKKPKAHSKKRIVISGEHKNVNRKDPYRDECEKTEQSCNKINRAVGKNQRKKCFQNTTAVE